MNEISIDEAKKKIKEIKEMQLNSELSKREHPSLRDWFAGLAMQGILISDQAGDFNPNDVAVKSFQQADIMIKYRK